MRYLPFKSSSIPNIIANVHEDHLVFGEVSRVLKEDGTAIISVPFTDGVKHSPLLMNLLHRFTRFWRIIPKGWFVLKDFIPDWMCWRLEERLLKMSRKGDGAVVKVRKKGGTYEFLEELTD
ncbi:hypothetical protein FHEFKHOI_01324 [Candidatus Methanoperedenaceae archaeon GB50]|nr:hypothetical protein FHEFKHOI_01324 [Candidatus Methanoperedenaceae archaeon GB50]CAD7780897.1 MAG: hypothetical protein KBONHNOK_01547 [Candidatus Methanoperedenaceae archaeon GB50]